MRSFLGEEEGAVAGEAGIVLSLFLGSVPTPGAERAGVVGGLERGVAFVFVRDARALDKPTVLEAAGIADGLVLAGLVMLWREPADFLSVALEGVIVDLRSVDDVVGRVADGRVAVEDASEDLFAAAVPGAGFLESSTADPAFVPFGLSSPELSDGRER